MWTQHDYVTEKLREFEGAARAHAPRPPKRAPRPRRRLLAPLARHAGHRIRHIGEAIEAWAAPAPQNAKG